MARYFPNPVLVNVGTDSEMFVYFVSKSKILSSRKNPHKEGGGTTTYKYWVTSQSMYFHRSDS